MTSIDDPALATGASKGTVLIVDDDTSVRRGLSSLFRSAGLSVEAFTSAAEMEQSPSSESANCLVLDVRMPAQSGLELQEKLAHTNRKIPIIFITAHADVPITLRAMKSGAVDLFTKPVDGRAILEAVTAAIAHDRARRERENAAQALRLVFENLTPREREVMAFVTAGLMNKQIAAEMGLREITVKIHRGNIMRKMKAGSLPDLVRMADGLGLSRPAT